MDKSLIIGGKTYELVSTQQRGASAIYRGSGEYLRIGEKSVIEQSLTVHKTMDAAGYPVAKLTGEGKLGHRYYFSEESLGVRPLGDEFEDDWKRGGNISEEHFRELLQIVERFADAQIGTHTTGSARELASGIFLDVLCDELPEYAERIRSRFSIAHERLSAFPFVLSHGDFNPRNLFPAGVIDLEHFFQAPFGFDLVTALVHVDLHPDTGEYEFLAKYRFSDEQKRWYFLMLDKLATKYQLPSISSHAADFAFLRAIWSTVRLDEWPKIQKWRYELLKQTYFS